MSATTINIVVFGIGNVGSELIKQILEGQEFFKKKFNIKINIPIVTNSKVAFFSKEELSDQWESDFLKYSQSFDIQDIFNFVAVNQLENLIAIDATASEQIIENYGTLIQKGFHIVAANKKANAFETNFYDNLRSELFKYDKQFLYETNVGAGLPVISTIHDLQSAGEKITKIRGVFSGTISYIFNRFGTENNAFSEILIDAESLGLTEPDSREDLSGNDVARKLLILSRELELKNEFHDVTIASLLTSEINALSKSEYLENKHFFDKEYEILKTAQVESHVLRYIGEIDVLQNKLEVKLVSVPVNSALGQLKGADNLIEIFTESYGEIPIVIQGAGAGKKVTARGVLSDVIKLARQIKKQNLVTVV